MEDKRKTVPFKKEELALPRPPERKTTYIYSDSEEDGSDEDEASDIENDGPTKITEQQRKLVAQVLTKRIDVPDPKDPESDLAKDFKISHKLSIEGLGKRGETLLHHIGDETKKSSRLIQLGSWLLEAYPSLILKPDIEGCTALYNAFKHDNRNLVRQVLKRPEAVETLRKPCLDGSTCFHAAFGSNYTGFEDILSTLKRGTQSLSDVAKEGSKKKDQKVLGKKDGAHNTPLHVVAISISAGKPTKMDKKWGERLKFLTESASRLMKESPDSMYQRNKKDQLPYHCCKKPSSVTDPDNMDPSIALGEEIKLDFMRNLQSGSISHEAVVEALYQDSDELRINFDLSWTSHQTISATEQERWVNHLRFENILQYVHLPNLILEDGGEPLISDFSENEQIIDLSALKGSVDALKVLDWLRRRGMGKGCNRRILEVTVEDDEDSPHSDEAIELALKDLEVEKLDWRRLDLCSDVIPQTVTEVYLYSSGNNAVLRGWSSENGLARLKKLKTVHLSIVQGFETHDRMKKYAYQFEDDLKKKIPGIVFHPPEFPKLHRPPTFSKTQKDANPAPRNPWLECMAKFAYFIQNNGRYIQKPNAEVKVAVIDDGIDLSHPIFNKRIVDGKSYLKRSTKFRSDRTMDYFVAPGGHGTDMATLICQICPTAKLYIVRLNEGRGGAGERQIMADSAAKAVEWARRNKVDIISMSWSIKSADLAETTGNEKDIKSLDNFKTSIRNAYNDGITMFCAASDLGKNRESAASSMNRLPAAWGDTITIGAADPDGSPSNWTGSQTVDFYLPGMDIVVDGHVPAQGQPKSGSSLATAVASGLAALIRYCIKAADGGDSSIDNALKPDAMKQAMQRLCSTNQRVPEVVKTFGNIDFDSLDTPEKVREKFQSIAADLRGKR